MIVGVHNVVSTIFASVFKRISLITVLLHNSMIFVHTDHTIILNVPR